MLLIVLNGCVVPFQSRSNPIKSSSTENGNDTSLISNIGIKRNGGHDCVVDHVRPRVIYNPICESVTWKIH